MLHNYNKADQNLLSKYMQYGWLQLLNKNNKWNPSLRSTSSKPKIRLCHDQLFHKKEKENEKKMNTHPKRRPGQSNRKVPYSKEINRDPTTEVWRVMDLHTIVTGIQISSDARKRNNMQ